MNLEHIETGPASQDRTAEAYWGTDNSTGTLKQQFLDACKGRDPSVQCAWAPSVMDWEHATGDWVPERFQTLAEIIGDRLEEGTSNELIAILLEVAYGSSLVSLPVRARYLLEQLAAGFAGENGK